MKLSVWFSINLFAAHLATLYVVIDANDILALEYIAFYTFQIIRYKMLRK